MKTASLSLSLAPRHTLTRSCNRSPNYLCFITLPWRDTRIGLQGTGFRAYLTDNYQFLSSSYPISPLSFPLPYQELGPRLHGPLDEGRLGANQTGNSERLAAVTPSPKRINIEPFPPDFSKHGEDEIKTEMKRK